MWRFVKFVSVFLIFGHQSPVSARFNVIIKRFEDCAIQNISKFYGHITRENENQFLDFDITLLRALDETVGLICHIESTLDGKTFIPLFTIREKNLCKAANTYLGEFWHDLLRAAQAIPGTCPLIAKRYYVHHHLLDFNNMALQTFPIGTIRTKTIAIDNTNRHGPGFFCVLTEFENLPN